MPPTDQEKDPVVNSSLSKPLYISAALLVLSLGWALYDEAYGTRPWKSYQERFLSLYSSYLKKTTPKEAVSEDQIKASSQYQSMAKAVQDARAKVAPRVKQIDDEINNRITPQVLEMNSSFQVLRSEIGSLTYEIEITKSESSKDSLRKKIAEIKARRVTVALPQPNGSAVKNDYTYPQMDELLQGWKKEKSTLLQERVDILKPATEAQAKLDLYMTDHVADASVATLRGIQNKLERFDVSIKQIHVKDIELVDRCESCHLGTREPIVLTKAAMGGEEAFISHPNKELLKVHDPEKFGCTPCHNGNGVNIASVEKAHGENKFWLWPLHHRENIQAGCQQCHVKEIVTEQADVLNQGREIFRRRGCMGCHRYEGFDRDPEDLTSARQQIRQLEQQRADFDREINQSIKKADNSKDNTEAQKLYQHADDLKVRISNINAKIEQNDIRSKDLLREVKKVGPSLKEVRMKMNKEWIPVWLKDPHQWRPGTKMPTFRLTDDEIKAISAAIWQSAVTGALPSNPTGDAEKGKEAFETRGCMACHSMGEGTAQEGGDFAANLSRVGEKDNYNYLVRWIHNPRERTLPYCSFEKRDLTEDDYKKKGLPFVFDVDHTRCPNDGHELVVQQMTPMPSLRLTIEEARDIATYLMSRKHPSASYPSTPWIEDAALRQKGQFLIRHYGCAGCHEISGLEEEQRIGTELTKEGSKPIERLDFALFTHEAQNEGWYSHKGFFEHKLQNPAVYDKGKEKVDRLELLKMPNFNLSKDDINAVTTFLIGSVDSPLPERYYYEPKDQKQDIIEGWWVVRKYNCMGCHQVMLGQKTVFQSLRRYQDPDWKDKRPPALLGEGARVSPEWLKSFLANPSMTETDTNRNGVRSYLQVRMPTFYLSDGEIRKLIRFFEALSSQAQPYIAQKLDPLTDQERSMARQLFSSEGAPCLKCHATGDATHDKIATAPNFTLAKERLKPGWTRRWILDPSMIMPGTAMPSGLFTMSGDHYIFAGPVPASFQGYQKDQADLLVRYMFQFTPDELTKLRSSIRSGSGY